MIQKYWWIETAMHKEIYMYIKYSHIIDKFYVQLNDLSCQIL